MRSATDLRPYQQRVATALYENDERLVIARPGSGKTIAALTAIAELLRDGVIRHALVIAPKRVARNVWPDELEEWTHTAGLTYQVMDGLPGLRLEQLKSAPKRNLTIVGLDVVQWLVGALADMPEDHPVWDLLVIDEASRLRNPTGKRARSLARIAGKWRMIWGLTGTLRPSGPLDLFMPARVVTRGKLWGRSFYGWRKQHFYPVDFMGYDWQILPGHEDILNAGIAPLTVTVADGEMPSTVPTIVFDRVTLPSAAWAEYDSMMHRLVAGAGDDAVVAVNAAVATGKLAQIANGFVYDNGLVMRRLHEVKREWLEDLIQEATDPTLLIYEFREDLDVMQETLGELPYLGAGTSDTQSDENIRAWNAGELPFMALHPASGGHGLNLQHGGADMAWFAPTWSPELWEQTIARIARPGQARPVVIRVCVATGTVDEMKLNRVYHKMAAQEAFEQYLRDWHKAKAAA